MSSHEGWTITYSGEADTSISNALGALAGCNVRVELEDGTVFDAELGEATGHKITLWLIDEDNAERTGEQREVDFIDLRKIGVY